MTAHSVVMTSGLPKGGHLEFAILDFWISLKLQEMEVKMAFNDAMPTSFDVIIPFCGRKLFSPFRFYCHIVNVL